MVNEGVMESLIVRCVRLVAEDCIEKEKWAACFFKESPMFNTGIKEGKNWAACLLEGWASAQRQRSLDGNIHGIEGIEVGRERGA